MKYSLSAFILYITFQVSAFANPFDRDLKIAYQNISNLKQLVVAFKSLRPTFEKLESQKRLDHNETFQVKRVWGRIFDMRVTLNTLTQTYQGRRFEDLQEDSKAALIKFSSTLALVNSGAEVSKFLWDMPRSHKMLNELHTNYPVGSLVSYENQIFEMFKVMPMETNLPSFFPAVDVEEQALEMAHMSFLSFNSEIETKLKNIQEEEILKFEQATKPFLNNIQNKWEVLKRFEIFKLKKMFLATVKKVSVWLGDTKLKRKDGDFYNGKTLIKLDQAIEFEKRLESGDIMISRTNWFLSNAFLPGFWPHSFIYVGNLAKLESLGEDEEVGRFYRAKCEKMNLNCDSFVSYLGGSNQTSKAFADYLTKAKDGHEKVLIEATSDGVHFSSIRHTFLNDFLAAMRPNVTKLDKALAIEESMKFHGFPYDFDFDFDTHSSLVCSELVAKSYAPNANKNGVTFDYDRKNGVYVEEYLKRYSLPVIGIAQKMVDENVHYLRSSELDFVGFLKGVRKDGKAVLASEDEFYDSVKWPKWSFMQ
ncbi:MAG: hypothetical protein KC478_11065 [Bacteriovoracaceae bacterium]|nr:hypothetical protein [Bacteriovoracaceae bacterium]